MKQIEACRSKKLAKCATFILVIGGIFCVLTSPYFVYNYMWTGQRHFIRPFGVMLYGVLPLALAGVLFGSLTLSPVWRINLALVVVSTAVSLHLTNIFLALYSVKAIATIKGTRDVNDVVKVAKQYGIDYDSRHRLEVIDDLHRRGINAVPVLAPIYFLREHRQTESGSQ